MIEQRYGSTRYTLIPYIVWFDEESEIWVVGAKTTSREIIASGPDLEDLMKPLLASDRVKYLASKAAEETREKPLVTMDLGIEL